MLSICARFYASLLANVANWLLKIGLLYSLELRVGLYYIGDTL